MFMRVLSLFFVLLLILTVTSLYIHSTSTSTPQLTTFLRASGTSPRAYTDPTPDAYYQIIIDNNIFRPLGWRPPVKQPQYELIGTTLSDKPMAILLDKQSNQQFTLGVGDKIGKATLHTIEPKRVILTHTTDQTTALTLSPLFLR